jgi:hypothetical protein
MLLLKTKPIEEGPENFVRPSPVGACCSHLVQETHIAHRLADHRECFLTDLVIRNNVIGTVEISLVELITRNEFVDDDRVRAFDLQRFDLFVLDLNVDVFVDLVAAALDRTRTLDPTAAYWLA